MSDVPPDALAQLTKEDLVAQITRLQTHVKQLQNIIIKKEYKGTSTNKHASRTFNFKKFKRRHIALKFLYLGWDRQGYVMQEDTTDTMEHNLFDALLKTKLIESRETSNYHRCGRTDKGVSAFSQVVSIDVRTNLSKGKGVFAQDDYEGPDSNSQQEVRYCLLLNKVLPDFIRCLSWAPVERDFSARFDCNERTYKYFIPLGTLNIDRMDEACQNLIGEHDFRNLCKMDIKNGVTTFKRKIKRASIKSCSAPDPDGFQLFELTIVGQAFLWHQIRCIVAVLLLVGDEKEDPSIITRLLNIEEFPQKPQYAMASEIPLVLFDSQFNEGVEKWNVDDEAVEQLTEHMQGMWAVQATKAQIIKRMLDGIRELQPDLPNVPSQHKLLTACFKPKIYKPLDSRQVCDSLEDRLRKSKRPRLENDDAMKDLSLTLEASASP